jgi:DNA-binding MarR family transcriptional regulator
MSQLGALLHIHREGSSAVSDLGDSLGVTNAAASQMLDRLVQQDLILRSEDPYDRRAKQISLTNKGQQVLEEGMCARLSWLGELSARLSETEKRQVIAAIEIMIENAE